MPKQQRRALTDDGAPQHGVPSLLLNGCEDAGGCPRGVEAVSDDAELAGGLGAKVLHDLGQPVGRTGSGTEGSAGTVAGARSGGRETGRRNSSSSSGRQAGPPFSPSACQPTNIPPIADCFLPTNSTHLEATRMRLLQSYRADTWERVRMPDTATKPPPASSASSVAARARERRW